MSRPSVRDGNMMKHSANVESLGNLRLTASRKSLLTNKLSLNDVQPSEPQHLRLGSEVWTFHAGILILSERFSKSNEFLMPSSQL